MLVGGSGGLFNIEVERGWAVYGESEAGGGGGGAGETESGST